MNGILVRSICLGIWAGLFCFEIAPVYSLETATVDRRLSEFEIWKGLAVAVKIVTSMPARRRYAEAVPQATAESP
jgi:hypothetical protein